jgi:hypothetical protein
MDAELAHERVLHRGGVSGRDENGFLRGENIEPLPCGLKTLVTPIMASCTGRQACDDAMEAGRVC